MKMTNEELKKELMDKYGVNSNPNVTTTPEPTVAPKQPNLFKRTAKKSEANMLTYKEITGYDHPDGSFTFPSDIIKEISDWPEFMQPYIPEVDDRHIPDHDYVLSLLRAVTKNKVLMAKGYPGTGKDSTIEWVCALLKWPVVRVDGAEGKLPGDIIGDIFPDGKGGYVHAEGLLTLFVKNGGVYIDSEPFVNSAAVNMCKQSLLEPKRILNIVGHPDPHKSQIKANKDFRIFLTTNTRGTGDDVDKFAATTVQDQSTLNRIDVHCTVGYLSAVQEQEMLHKAYPKLTDALTNKMVQLAGLIRSAWLQGSIEMPFSPRQLLEWAESSLDYQEPVRGFKQCYFNALDDTEKGIVTRLWEDVSFGKWML